METIDITNLNKEQIINLIKISDDFNFRTPKGFIYLVGGMKEGILGKIENHNEFLFVDNEWVKV